MATQGGRYRGYVTRMSGQRVEVVVEYARDDEHAMQLLIHKYKAMYAEEWVGYGCTNNPHYQHGPFEELVEYMEYPSKDEYGYY